MKTRWRIVVAASAVLMTAGAPALAQDSAPPAAPPAQRDIVGPPQLQNFSLEGRVTREAPAPAPVQTQQRPRQSAAESGGAQNAQASSSRPPQPSRETTATAARTEAPAAERPARSTAAADEPSPAPATRIATPALGETADAAALSPQPAFVPATVEPAVDGSPGGVPMLPWLIATLALVATGAWYFLRQRPRERYATAGGIDLFEAPPSRPAPAPAPTPAPRVRTPPPAPAPEQPSSGLVSTRLRPWLEIEFKPERAVLDDDKVTIAFELSVFNSGSAPARDVLLEASLFNAGPMQDQQILAFFENPVAKGERIPIIPPLQRISVNTGVFLRRGQIQPIEVEGRQLFVPMIAFNALYGWGKGGGQTSASYLVGKMTKTDKLAPLRLDLGPRVFRGLDVREHQVRLRR